MKVYYEKLDGLKIMQDVLALAEKYENSTGKKPNRVSLTKEEFDALEEYFKKIYYYWYNQERDKALGLSISGMEIVIED